MDLMLKGKVAIVTGAGEGIGRRTSLTLGAEGANVVVSDIIPEKAEKLAGEIQALGVKALGMKADVGNEADVKKMVATTIEKFGTVDILVNNAGRGANWEGGGKPTPFVETERKDWDYTIDICLYGTLNCVRAVLPHMIEKKYGKIVSMVSDAGKMGEANLAAYSAAKGGIIAFTKALAREVGRYNINANCVSAGATKTERYLAAWAKRREQIGDEAFEKWMEKFVRVYPMNRLGEPIDLSRMVVFLSSDCTGWVTGQTFSVSGGFSMM